MKPNFIFRPYQIGDEHAIQAGFAEVFASYRTLETWHWIYTHNPEGARIMLAWAENGELAAHYAGTVHTATWDGQPVTVGLIRDIFSNPAYRTFSRGRRGIFIQTIEEFVNIWTGANQLIMLYGFPSERSFRIGQLFMRYQPLTHWYYYRYPVPTEPRQHTALGVLNTLEHFDSAFDHLWERRVQHYSFAIHRTARFLNWRFIEIPHRHYWIWRFSAFLSDEVLGYLVIAPNQPQAQLVDFCFPEEPQLAHSFWQQVVERLRWRGIKMLETWFAGSGSESQRLHALGFQSHPLENPMTPVFRSFHEDLDSQWLDAHFYYTMADSDLY